MIRLAAAGDLHFAADSVGRLRPHLEAEADGLDLLLLAGDLTWRGNPDEASVLAAELKDLACPVVAVLGNHDFHLGMERAITEVLEGAGVRVLDGSGVTLAVQGQTVGVAGVKGFGGGFAGACATDFGEPEMKAFVAATRHSARALEAALVGLQTDVRIALLHYSPVEGTLIGEVPPLWPFLGSYLLADAVDGGGADLVLHGHAHGGRPEGVTAGGIRVLNVAQPVIRRPFVILELEAGRVAQPAADIVGG